MAKETYYFSHDSNAIVDTKILNMRSDYGMEGYGLFWAIIEMLRNEENYKLEYSNNTYRAVKTLTNTTIDVEQYINDCINDYQLFKAEDGFFYSNSLMRRMQEKDNKKRINQENGKLGGRPRKTEIKSNGFESETQKNQNKIKENKEKENKEKEITTTVVDDSCGDDLQKIVDFYENNIGAITPFGFEVLSSYAEEMSVDLVILAMKKSVESNKRSIQYIKGILNNWNKKGIKTVLEAEQEDEAFRNKNNTTEETEEEKIARKIRELEESQKNANF